MKILVHKFSNLKQSVKQHKKMYNKIDFKESYPANVKRLEIFLSLLKKYKPKKIVDAGCGSGMPLIKFKKKGYNITGYDKAKNMVKLAKDNLIKNNLSETLVRLGDFENPKHINDNSVDCILGMGTFYYSKKFIKTLRNQRKKLKKNGRLIFSLRNKIFDISTLNDYSIKFYSQLYGINKFETKVKRKFLRLFKGYSNRKKFNLKNMDDYNVFSKTHNPLTIEKEILKKVGLKLNGIYFYHYHILPPVFENFNKLYFRKQSYKIENPNDWRGFFIASGFVVDSQKI